MSLCLISERQERCEEGLPCSPQSEEHQGRDGFPKKADLFHGRQEHSHREAPHARIQTE